MTKFNVIFKEVLCDTIFNTSFIFLLQDVGNFERIPRAVRCIVMSRM